MMFNPMSEEEIAAWWAAIDELAKKAPVTRDNEGKRCRICGKGKYTETSIHDDIDGTRTCPKCYHTVPHMEIVR